MLECQLKYVNVSFKLFSTSASLQKEATIRIAVEGL